MSTEKIHKVIYRKKSVKTAARRMPIRRHLPAAESPANIFKTGRKLHAPVYTPGSGRVEANCANSTNCANCANCAKSANSATSK